MFSAYLCIVLAALSAAEAQKPKPTVSTVPTTGSPTPVDCRLVRCALPECEQGTYSTTLKGSCCPTCEACPLPFLPCPLLVCSEVVYSTEYPCACPTCILFTGEPTETTSTTVPPKKTRPTVVSTSTSTSPPPKTKPTTSASQGTGGSTRPPTRPTGTTSTTVPPKKTKPTEVSTETSTSPPPTKPTTPASQGTGDPTRPTSVPPPKTKPTTLATQGTVTATTATPDVCSLDSERGPCKARMRRYYYNSASGQCELFVYGGCRGNGNNFRTPTECQAACPSPTSPTTSTTRVPTKPVTTEVLTETSTSPPPKTEPATPSGNTECELRGQVFTECGTACPAVCGEERPFFCTLQCVAECQCPFGTTLDKASAQCVTECPTGTSTETSASTSPPPKTKPTPTTPPTTAGTLPDLCLLPKDKGSCTDTPRQERLRRYYYNTRRGRCKRFAYTGCGGNENRFSTRVECQKTCG